MPYLLYGVGIASILVVTVGACGMNTERTVVDTAITEKGKTMSKSEKYTVAQVVPKESVIALGDDFVKYIADDLIRELSKKVLERAEFSDVIVSLKPMRTAEITAWNQVEYRRNMIIADVVRCKDCKHYWKNYIDDYSVPVCLASPQDEAFCSEGERIDDE